MFADAPIAPVTSPVSWRRQAAHIVEELFQVTAADAWDALLDLRQLLLHGSDWNRALDAFLGCRERLEADHYLPFYRLRRLLTASLRLEAGAETRTECGSLAELLQRRPASLADIKRTVRREMFEHSLDLPANHRIPLHVVERA
jgi:hypothetical protein